MRSGARPHSPEGTPGDGRLPKEQPSCRSPGGPRTRPAASRADCRLPNRDGSRHHLHRRHDDERRAGDGILGPLALRITYADGRGRIDVLARAKRPAVRAKWVILSHPGRCQAITTSSTARALSSCTPQRSISRAASCTGASFGECLIREVARGRTDVINAPADEAGVVRWFGPTRALAHVTEVASLVGRPVRLTAVAQWRAVRGDSVTTIPTIRFLSGLREVAVMPSTLAAPRGFREL